MENLDMINSFFAEECVAAHNAFRRKHKTPVITLNKRLCDIAQNWADHLANKKESDLENDVSYDENVYISNHHLCLTSTCRIVPYNSEKLNDPSLEKNLYVSSIYEPLKSSFRVIHGCEPTKAWYATCSKYEYFSEPKSSAAFPFTRIIWKETRELGVGMAIREDNTVFIVCVYSPKGNIDGLFFENVSPLGGFPDPMPDKPFHLIPPILPYRFAREALKLHNLYREHHGVPPLVLSDKLCDFAQEWACRLAEEDKFFHRAECPYGENLFSYCCCKSKESVTPESACAHWYSTGAEYRYDIEPPLTDVRVTCFTQIIWRTTEELGVGVAKAASNMHYIVANYYPKGNVIGKFVDNVLPPILRPPDILKEKKKSTCN